jgi:predicted nucleic acid-binding protein
MAALRTNVEALLREYEVIATVMHLGQVPRFVAADADDDRVIAAAVTARVDLIVSGDRHLLNLGSHQGIAIVSVRQAIERIAQARDQ